MSTYMAFVSRCVLAHFEIPIFRRVKDRYVMLFGLKDRFEMMSTTVCFATSEMCFIFRKQTKLKFQR